ncbi:MAG: PhnD/SsuA/transferrin family substrate-binding protein, partial [Coleofasciculus sp. S288]|nr:PhnD/SsuA/transferrin family substrate-binding protein [Coleofasciculus sp. S288]
MTEFPKIPVKRWLKGIFVGALALLVLVSCNNQPKVQTPPTAASDSTAKLTELKFGVELFFPTPDENRKQFKPLFNELAKQANLSAKVTVAENWADISEALSSGTLDVAWLSSWGYVLADRNAPSIQAIATVKYKDRPTYYALLMARTNAPFNTLDQA